MSYPDMLWSVVICSVVVSVRVAKLVVGGLEKMCLNDQANTCLIHFYKRFNISEDGHGGVEKRNSCHCR